MTTTDANKQIVDAFITGLFTHGDLTAVDRYLDPGFVNHDPPMPGLPPGPEGMRQAGEIVLQGINIFRVADGKIVERWGRLDQLGLLQQLGLAPQPSAAESRR